MQIILDRKAVMDLSSLLEIWATPLPEVVSRKRIVLGQTEVGFYNLPKAKLTSLGFFDKPTHGNLIHNVRTLPSMLFVNSGDAVIYRISCWDKY